MENTAMSHFFETLFPYTEVEYSLEIRCIHDGKVPLQKWFYLTELHEAEQCAIECASKWDTYFGVLPRTYGKGRQEDVKETRAIWCDIDGGSEGVKGATELLKSAVDNFTMPVPNIIVRSGNGLHVYWLLHKSFGLLCAVDRDTFKTTLKRLCLAIGGKSPLAHADSSRADSASILRPPDTFNYKDRSNPKAVKMLRCEPDPQNRLSLIAWRSILPVEQEVTEEYIPEDDFSNRETARRWDNGHANQMEAKRSLPAAILDMLKFPVGNGNRHPSCQKLLVAAKKRGYSFNEILTMGRDFCQINQFPQKEMERSLKWVMKQVI